MPRWLHFILGVSLVADITFSVCAAEVQPSLVPVLQDGDYYNTAFLDTLKRTHSISKAEEAGNESHLISIHRQNGESYLGIRPNFHEGVDYQLSPDGSYQDAFGANSIKILDAQHFLYSGDVQQLPELYVYTSDSVAEINNRTLSGHYQDHDGKDYFFETDGKAAWPDGLYKYYLELDLIGLNIDEEGKYLSQKNYSDNESPTLSTIKMYNFQNPKFSIKYRYSKDWSGQFGTNVLKLYKLSPPDKIETPLVLEEIR